MDPLNNTCTIIDSHSDTSGNEGISTGTAIVAYSFFAPMIPYLLTAGAVGAYRVKKALPWWNDLRQATYEWASDGRSKRFDTLPMDGAPFKQCLTDLASKVSQGGIIVVVGQSGAGKSTLVHALVDRILRGEIASLKGITRVKGIRPHTLLASKTGGVVGTMRSTLFGSDKFNIESLLKVVEQEPNTLYVVEEGDEILRHDVIYQERNRIANDRFRLVIVCTQERYNQMAEFWNEELCRRFSNSVKVTEWRNEEVIDYFIQNKQAILSNFKKKHSIESELSITDDAIRRLVSLTPTYKTPRGYTGINPDWSTKIFLECLDKLFVQERKVTIDVKEINRFFEGCSSCGTLAVLMTIRNAEEFEQQRDEKSQIEAGLRQMFSSSETGVDPTPTPRAIESRIQAVRRYAESQRGRQTWVHLGTTSPTLVRCVIQQAFPGKSFVPFSILKIADLLGSLKGPSYCGRTLCDELSKLKKEGKGVLIYEGDLLYQIFSSSDSKGPTSPISRQLVESAERDHLFGALLSGGQNLIKQIKGVSPLADAAIERVTAVVPNREAFDSKTAPENEPNIDLSSLHTSLKDKIVTDQVKELLEAMDVVTLCRDNGRKLQGKFFEFGSLDLDLNKTVAFLQSPHRNLSDALIRRAHFYCLYYLPGFAQPDTTDRFLDFYKEGKIEDAFSAFYENSRGSFCTVKEWSDEEVDRFFAEGVKSAKLFSFLTLDRIVSEALSQLQAGKQVYLVEDNQHCREALAGAIVNENTEVFEINLEPWAHYPYLMQKEQIEHQLRQLVEKKPKFVVIRGVDRLPPFLLEEMKRKIELPFVCLCESRSITQEPSTAEDLLLNLFSRSGLSRFFSLFFKEGEGIRYPLGASRETVRTQWAPSDNELKLMMNHYYPSFKGFSELFIQAYPLGLGKRDNRDMMSRVAVMSTTSVTLQKIATQLNLPIEELHSLSNPQKLKLGQRIYFGSRVLLRKLWSRFKATSFSSQVPIQGGKIIAALFFLQRLWPFNRMRK